MQSWHGILAMRMLLGLSLSGVAAVAMTYLAEEIRPDQAALDINLDAVKYLDG
jgi:YNFM family putative membrane transporter